MTRTEYDLKQVLAERSGGVPGSAPEVEAIVRRGRSIRRRRRWGAALAAGAAVAAIAALIPLVLPDPKPPQPAAPPGDGGRLAYARLDGYSVQQLQPTVRGAGTVYRVDCLGDTWAFVRAGDQVDKGRCGIGEDRRFHMMGGLRNVQAGDKPVVDVLTVKAAKVPSWALTAAKLSSGDFDRLAALGVSGSPGEVSIHDGGVTSDTCSKDICPPKPVFYPKTNTKVSFRVMTGGPGRLVVQCRQPGMRAIVWDSDNRLVKTGHCAEQFVWQFTDLTKGARVAVVDSRYVHDAFLRNPTTETAEEAVKLVSPAPSPWLMAFV
ncbi:hypothetical protein [Nonomuraea typhae]|uniref:Rieske domain-containing protein n=1 Tax=Nonomuraea typhae TaxID=2603600 RepID=A0ABW7Z0V9_9ACTN